MSMEAERVSDAQNGLLLYLLRCFAIALLMLCCHCVVDVVWDRFVYVVLSLFLFMLFCYCT